MGGRLGFAALRRVLLILIGSFQESTQLILLLFSHSTAMGICSASPLATGSSDGAGV